MQRNSRNLPDVFLLAFLHPFITYHRVKFEKVEARFLHFYLSFLLDTFSVTQCLMQRNETLCIIYM